MHGYEWPRAAALAGLLGLSGLGCFSGGVSTGDAGDVEVAEPPSCEALHLACHYAAEDPLVTQCHELGHDPSATEEQCAKVLGWCSTVCRALSDASAPPADGASCKGFGATCASNLECCGHDCTFHEEAGSICH